MVDKEHFSARRRVTLGGKDAAFRHAIRDKHFIAEAIEAEWHEVRQPHCTKRKYIFGLHINVPLSFTLNISAIITC